MTENTEPGIRDHESDPAHTPDDGWGEEGGASHLGPATHIRAAQPDGVKIDEDDDAEEDAADEEE